VCGVGLEEPGSGGIVGQREQTVTALPAQLVSSPDQNILELWRQRCDEVRRSKCTCIGWPVAAPP
jgi:hypothetical protein